MKRDLALLLSSILIVFTFVEIGYRIFDPYPYISKRELNVTEHGNLSEYDPLLGWRGKPNGQGYLATWNSKVWLENNQLGFRDVEHTPEGNRRPSIVFLGDSFTWGFEVEAEDMFVNRLRSVFPSYEIYNLAHRGYGTDQAWLNFQHWKESENVKWVVLMFSQNDVGDNHASYSHGKFKPKFQLVGGVLELTNVPVPVDDAWVQEPEEKPPYNGLRAIVGELLFSSHALHDAYSRLRSLSWENVSARFRAQAETPPGPQVVPPPDPITSAILAGLKADVEERGARLVVVFVPSKDEVYSLRPIPYQASLKQACKELEIPCFDPVVNFKETPFRTYYRPDMHLNAKGHEVMAQALEEILESLVDSAHPG